MKNIPHILIVDDDTALLQALPQALFLRMPNVNVDTSDSAAGALQLIQSREYDAIVSDIKMPGLDGFDLLALASQQYILRPCRTSSGVVRSQRMTFQI